MKRHLALSYRKEMAYAGHTIQKKLFNVVEIFRWVVDCKVEPVALTAHDR